MIGIIVSGRAVPTAARTDPTAPSASSSFRPNHSIPFVNSSAPARMTTKATTRIRMSTSALEAEASATLRPMTTRIGDGHEGHPPLAAPEIADAGPPRPGRTAWRRRRSARATGSRAGRGRAMSRRDATAGRTAGAGSSGLDALAPASGRTRPRAGRSRAYVPTVRSRAIDRSRRTPDPSAGSPVTTRVTPMARCSICHAV